MADEPPVAASPDDPWSPWATRNGWRLGGFEARRFDFVDGDTRHVVDAIATVVSGTHRLVLPGGTRVARVLSAPPGRVRIDLDGHVVEASAVRSGATLTLDDGIQARRLVILDALASAGLEEDGGGRFVAPMPGRIVTVRCESGARVTRGQVLVVLEAMKMEHAILAPADGVVEALRCRQGEQVTEGSELLVFRPEAT